MKYSTSRWLAFIGMLFMAVPATWAAYDIVAYHAGSSLFLFGSFVFTCGWVLVGLHMTTSGQKKEHA